MMMDQDLSERSISTNIITFSTKVKTKRSDNMKSITKKNYKSINQKQVIKSHSFPRFMSPFKKRLKAKNVFVVTELCADQNNTIKKEVNKNQLNVEKEVRDGFIGQEKPKRIQSEQPENRKIFKSKIIQAYTPEKGNDSFNLKIEHTDNKNKKSIALKVDEHNLNCTDILSNDTFHQPKKLKVKKNVRDSYIRQDKANHIQSEQSENSKFFKSKNFHAGTPKNEDDTFNLKIVCSSNEKKKSTALNVDKRDFSCKDMLSDDTFHQPKKLKIKKKNQDNYFRPEKPKRTEAEQCKNRIFFNIQTLPSNKKDDTFNIKIMHSSDENKESTAVKIGKQDFNCTDMLSDNTFHQPKKIKVKKKVCDDDIGKKKSKPIKTEQSEKNNFLKTNIIHNHRPNKGNDTFNLKTVDWDYENKMGTALKDDKSDSNITDIPSDDAFQQSNQSRVKNECQDNYFSQEKPKHMESKQFFKSNIIHTSTSNREHDSFNTTILNSSCENKKSIALKVDKHDFNNTNIHSDNSFKEFTELKAKNKVWDDIRQAKLKLIETEQSENRKYFKSKIIHNHTPNKEGDKDDSFNLKIVNWNGENMMSTAVKDDKSVSNITDIPSDNAFQLSKQYQVKKKVQDNYFSQEKSKCLESEQCKNRDFIKSNINLINASNKVDDSFHLNIINRGNEKKLNTASEVNKYDFNRTDTQSDDKEFDEEIELKAKNKVWDNYIRQKKLKCLQGESSGNRKSFKSNTIQTSAPNRENYCNHLKIVDLGSENKIVTTGKVDKFDFTFTDMLSDDTFQQSKKLKVQSKIWDDCVRQEKPKRIITEQCVNRKFFKSRIIHSSTLIKENDSFNLRIVNWGNENKMNTVVKGNTSDFISTYILSD